MTNDPVWLDLPVQTEDFQSYRFDLKKPLIAASFVLRSSRDADSRRWAADLIIKLPLKRATEYHTVCEAIQVNRLVHFDRVTESGERAYFWTVEDGVLRCREGGEMFREVDLNIGLSPFKIFHSVQLVDALAESWKKNTKIYRGIFVAAKNLYAVEFHQSGESEFDESVRLRAFTKKIRQIPAAMNWPEFKDQASDFSIDWNGHDRKVESVSFHAPIIGELALTPSHI